MKSRFGGRQGFFVVELIMALAVVAVLLGVAMPTYWDYRARSQAWSALSAIDAGRLVYEEEALAGTPQTLASLGLPEASKDCSSISVTPTAPAGMATVAALKCQIRMPRRLGRGAALQFDRTAEGDYICIATGFAAPQLAPRSCTVAGPFELPLRR